MVLRLTFKHVALFCGFVESFFFCAVIYGLNSLFETLKKENLFASYCNNSLNLSIISNESLQCDIQDKYYGYILITTSSAQCILAIPLSLLYDKIGLKFSKVFVAFVLLFACLFFAFSFKYLNYLVFVSAVLFGIVLQMLLYCNYNLGHLYPQYKNLILSLISGTTASSALVFTVFAYIHLYGVSLFSLFLGLGLFGFFEMMLSAGLNLDRINEYLQDLKKQNYERLIKVDNAKDNNDSMLITNNTVENNQILNENCDETFFNRYTENGDSNPAKILESYKNSSYPTLISILRSPYYICHFFYMLVIYFRYKFFFAEIALQLNYHFLFQPDLVNKLLSVISYFFLVSLIICPISGIIIDKSKARIIRFYRKKWSNTYVYKKYVQCFIVPQVLCSIINLLLSILIMIPDEKIVYITFLCCSVTRAIFFSFISSYLFELFPVKFFNKILGITTLMAGLINVIQYFILFKDPYYLNIMNYFLLTLSFLTLSYPIYLIFFNNRRQCIR